MFPRHFAITTPDKPAYILSDTGETVTYAQLERRANRFAHWLRAQGLGRGDVVAMKVGNHPRTYELVWGAQRAGIHYCLVPTSSVAGEVEYIVSDSGAKVLVVLPDHGDQAGANAAFSCQVIDIDALTQAMQNLPSEPIADEAPGADMLYSSGSTGRPKGIKMPVSESFDTVTRAEGLGAAHFGFSRDAVYLVPAPLYHAAPLRWSLAIHRLGGTVILMPRFDAEAALAAIDRYKVTVAQFVPTHFSRLLGLPDEVKARYDLSSLQSVFHAGAPCPVAVKRAMIDWIGPIVHEFYSGTESVGITVISCAEWLERPGSVGRAVQGDIHICDADGEPLPVGQEGMIHFANVRTIAYFNDAEKSQSAHNKYGWPTLGDIGRVDEAGYLYLTDRANFMIISGGVNIYPQEIENWLIEHPQVADVAVVGLPDEAMGERVTAFVEPAIWPVADEAALTHELDQFARGGLNPVKIPRRYVYRKSLDRTESGKIMKRALRAAYLAEQ